MLRAVNTLLVAIPFYIATRWILTNNLATWIPQKIKGMRLFEQVVRTPEGTILLSSVNWTLGTKLIGLCSDIVAVAPFFLALLLIRKIFINYREIQVFTSTNARRYKIISYITLTDALITKPISNMLMVLAVTINNGPGNRYFVLSVNEINFKMFMLGLLLFKISSVMEEATYIFKQENSN